MNFSYGKKGLSFSDIPAISVSPPTNERDLAFREEVFAPVATVLRHLSLTSTLFGRHFNVDEASSWRWQHILTDENGLNQSLSFRTDTDGEILIRYERTTLINLFFYQSSHLQTSIWKTKNFSQTLYALGQIFPHEQVSEAEHAFYRSVKSRLSPHSPRPQDSPEE